MILLLRGHIRNAFDNDLLHNFVKKLVYIYPKIHIILHTWDVFSNGISWRNINMDNRQVKVDYILSYFSSVKDNIKEIIISSNNDKDVKLYGNLSGKINNSMPIIGWKHYWCGKYIIMNNIYNNNIFSENELIINTRYDLFCNSNNFHEQDLFNFIKKYEDKILTKNIFLKENQFFGLDNFYIGNKNTMYKLICHFHMNLDKIIKLYPNVINQEFMVFGENNKLFNN